MSDVTSIAEFARRLPCSPRTAYRLFAQNLIGGYTVGRRQLVYASEVTRWRAENANGAGVVPPAPIKRRGKDRFRHLH